MDSAAKGLGWLRNAVIGVFLMALIAGLFLPLYSDEMGWRLQERAAIDGVDKLFTEVCGPNTLARPPLWMMPSRYYSALFNTLFPSPLFVRLSGILYALVWTGMVLALVRRAAVDARARTALSTLAIAFLGLGTMPLLLVLSRPEQPIMLAYTGAILIALVGTGRTGVETSVRSAWLRSLALLALALVAMSYHVKGVAVAPLFVLCMALASRGSRAILPRIVPAVLLLAAAIQAGLYWVHRFVCPDDAFVRADLTRSAGGAMVSAADNTQVMRLIAKAFGNLNVLLYPGTPAPRPNPMAFWLPAGQIGFEHSFLWFLVMVSCWVVALVATAWCLLRAVQRGWRERRVDARVVLALALLATGIGWTATGFTGVYEATFALPMMVFGVVLALATHENDDPFAAGVRFAAGGLGLLAIASVAAVAAIYGPALAAKSHERGYIAGQPLSTSIFGYEGLRGEILAAARNCGIVGADGHHALMIDDVTYFTFMKSRMPQHPGQLMKQRDLVPYLRSINSDGMILSCRLLPPALRARAKSDGQFCCLAPPNW